LDTSTNYIQAVGTLEQPKDAGKGGEGQVKLWMQALELSTNEETDWRKRGSEVIEIYRAASAVQSAATLNAQSYKYNILYSNTDTMAPALYNSTPVPDIRRRFGEPDPIAKIASTVLERVISYGVDTYDFDSVMRAAVKDELLPGRAVTRVRYKPYMETRQERVSVIKGENGYTLADGQPLPRTGMGDMKGPQTGEAETPVGEVKTDTGGSYIDGKSYEAVSYEETYCEHVQWSDFRRGPGKTWDEVPWIAFRHSLTRDEIKKLNKEVGAKIPMDSSVNPESQQNQGYQAPEPDIFKRLTVWEFWDKGTQKVYFIAPSYKEAPLKVEDDPLGLSGFFPIPRPLYAVETPETLIPVEPFRLYRSLADELDIVTRRLTALTRVMKWRGIYAVAQDGANYLDQLKSGDDGDLTPAQGAFAFAQQGGISNYIWLMPLNELAQVIDKLSARQLQIKDNIYEITGISDILRGSTQASETLGAQQLKAQWGSLRLSQKQTDVQRYARDLFRMMAEIAAEKFSPETLQVMTGIELPMDKKALLIQLQAQGVPPEQIQQQIASAVTWEDVIALLRNDAKRSFRIDIETDSTIQADVQRTQRNISEFIGGFAQFISAVGPAVQEGALTQEAASAMMKSFAQAFKLPRAAMDALDNIGNAPPNNAEAEKAKVQGEQMKAQAEQARTQAEIQRTQLDGQIAQMQAQSEQQKIAMEAQFRQEEHAFKMEELRYKHEATMAELAAKASMPKQKAAAE
jgi:hypothetical protein